MSSELENANQVQGLAFSAVTKTVKIGPKEDYRILSNISGVIYSSQMMALIGLSGCGYVQTDTVRKMFTLCYLLLIICRKTTLLHVLSGHLPRQEFEGDILLDGNNEPYNNHC
jgi:hypothetical protein